MDKINNKYCLIFNLAAHYRKELYEVFDRNLQFDLVAGDSIGDIKAVDLSYLNNNVYIVKNRKIRSHVIWQSGVLRFLFRRYSAYFMTGDPRCISTWMMLIGGKLLRKKMIVGGHGWYGKEKHYEKVIKKLFYLLAYRVVVYGNYAKSLMIKEGINANKIFIHHNSLAYNRQIILREAGLESAVYKHHFNNNNPTLIFIGRLTKIKHLDLIIQALSKLKTMDFFLNLIFVGDGEEKTHLLNLVKDLGIEENVWFYGACYDEKTNAELIYNADLCVAPGNVGLTAMHSMMFGTPVITHNNFPFQMPEFEAIIPGETGDFFDYEKLDSLVETIYNWFSTHQDRQQTREVCYKEIDNNWTPQIQFEGIRNALVS